jgi:hypothetical protein
MNSVQRLSIVVASLLMDRLASLIGFGFSVALHLERRHGEISSAKCGFVLPRALMNSARFVSLA